MISVVESTRLMWCSGLAQLQGKPKGNMQEWLSSATFAPSVVGGSIFLGGIDKLHFLGALAGDINRTSSAASETLHNIVAITEIPKSLGWAYVKLYYAALFYAHALLRVWGRSPSYLRTSDLLGLRQATSAYGVQSPFKLQTGQFFLNAHMPATSVEIAPDRGGGGSHEAMWRELHRSLAELQSLINQSQYLQADKQRLVASIASAISLLSGNGSNHSWPSQMRNEIQYRQSDGLWYPYKGKGKLIDFCNEVGFAIKGTKSIDQVLMTGGSELSRFRGACEFIILLCRGVLADLDSYGGPKGFLRHGQAQFENALVAA